MIIMGINYAKQQLRIKVGMIMKNSNLARHHRYFFVLLSTVCCLLSTASFAQGIRSRSAVVMDASTGEILYAKNPYLKRPPASTTKLMTAMIAVENANLSDLVRISRNASRISPHKAGFREGDQVTVEELLYAALLGSANDAAVALSEAVAGSETKFVTLMNGKARAIGAVNTRFINSSGLPGRGQYTTAYDLSKIMNYVLRYQKLKEIIGTRVAAISMENGNSIFLRNTNMLLWSEEDLIGGKTGYTRKAMHCFVCASERENDTVIVAILGSPSRDSLWRESSTLLSKGFEVLGNKDKPFVSETKTHPDKADIRKASYEETMRIKAWSLKLKKGNKIVSQKTPKHKKTKISAKKNSKTKVLVKKKGEPFAKNNRYEKKNLNISEQSVPDRNKG
jgi:D-alanyl-D-alanine carboxypeptidase (penicillin-binding protein 5/6)